MTNKFQKYYDEHDLRFNLFILFVLIVLLYHFKYGLGMLVPTNIGWLMWGDFAGFVTGNVIFRNEPWGFPIGHVTGYYYPIGTNVGEVLPILVKLLSPVLPENFQYIGLFLLSSHVLLAWFTLKIFRHFQVNGIVQLLGTLLIVINPVLLYRFIHPGLTPQWLIVASFWLYLESTNKQSPNKILLWQGGLMLLGSLIFPYLAVMLSGFVAAVGIKLWLVDHKITFLKFGSFIIATLASVAVCWYVIGLIDFSSSVQMDVANAYGLYGWNLNSLFNAYDLDGNGYYQTNNLSSFLPALPHVTWHQYEGFSYLGVGMMSLLLVALALFIKNKFTGSKKEESPGTNYVPLLLVTAAFTIFAISNVVTFNDQVLFRIPIPQLLQKFGDIFRASGRFIWPAYYLLLFAIVIFLSKALPARVIATLFFIALAAQVYDIRKMIFGQHFSYERYHSPLQDERWQELLAKFDKISFFPPYLASTLTHDDYRYFSYFAAINKQQINTGYLARIDFKAVDHFTHEMQTELRTPLIHDDALYISTAPWAPDLFKAFYGGKIEMVVLDGYFVFFSTRYKDELAQVVEKIKESNDQKIMTDLFTLVDPSPAHVGPKTGNIRMNMYEVYTISNVAYIKGWAFMDGSEDVAGDSITVILRSEKSTWSVPSLRIATPDVADFFHNPKLTQTGFLSAVRIDKLGKQPLQIGISIQNKKTGTSSTQWSSSFVEFADSYAKPVALQSLPPEHGGVKVNFDAVTNTGNELTIEGWAFLEKPATTVKLQIVFFSESKSYAFSPVRISRNDVADYFKNDALINSGFRVKLKKDELEKGIYRVGVLFTDTVRNKTFFQKGTDAIVAGYPEFETPEPFSEVPSGRDTIRAFFDRIDVKEEDVQMEGWAFLNQVSTDNTQSLVLLKSTEGVYSLATEPVRRDDIRDHFKLPYNVDLAGFKVKFKKDKILHGTYKVGIIMLNKTSNQKTSTYLNNTIDID